MTHPPARGARHGCTGAAGGLASRRVAAGVHAWVLGCTAQGVAGEEWGRKQTGIGIAGSTWNEGTHALHLDQSSTLRT